MRLIGTSPRSPPASYSRQPARSRPTKSRPRRKPEPHSCNAKPEQRPHPEFIPNRPPSDQGRRVAIAGRRGMDVLQEQPSIVTNTLDSKPPFVLEYNNAI